MKTWACFVLPLLATAALVASDRSPAAPYCTTAVGSAPAAPGCVAPVQACGPQCRGGGRGCPGGCNQCKPPCPGEEERFPGEQETAPGVREVGAFVAPPRVGSMRGPTVRRGWEGCSITFPELRLKLPCIEFPHAYTSRSQARMEIDEAVAPWESQGFVATTGELGRRESAPESGPGECAASEKAAKESAAAEDYARRLQEYERLLKQCEKQQQELRACIQQCLEQHPGNARANGGGDHAPVQKPEGGPQQAPPGGLYGPKPEVDPSAMVRPPVYAERPAAYISEPARLAPQQHWIREPAAPAGRITGLRPATR